MADDHGKPRQRGVHYVAVPVRLVEVHVGSEDPPGAGAEKHIGGPRCGIRHSLEHRLWAAPHAAPGDGLMRRALPLGDVIIRARIPLCLYDQSLHVYAPPEDNSASRLCPTRFRVPSLGTFGTLRIGRPRARQVWGNQTGGATATALAKARSRVWDREMSTTAIPCLSAARFAPPRRVTVGLPSGSLRISISRQAMARHPRPSAFITASLAANRAAKRMPRAWGGLARSSSAEVKRRDTNASPQRSSACSILRTSTMSIPTPRTSVMRDRPPRPNCAHATTDRRPCSPSRRQLRLIDEHDGNPFADWIAAAALRAHDPITLQPDGCLVQRTGEDLQQFLVDQRTFQAAHSPEGWV